MAHKRRVPLVFLMVTTGAFIFIYLPNDFSEKINSSEELASDVTENTYKLPSAWNSRLIANSTPRTAGRANNAWDLTPPTSKIRQSNGKPETVINTPIKFLQGTPLPNDVNNNNNDKTEQTSCLFGTVDPFDPAIREHITLNKHHIKCSEGIPSLVYLDNDMLWVNFTKVIKTVGRIDYCRYRRLEFSDVNDSSLRRLKWSKKFSKKPMELTSNDEHLHIVCFFRDYLVGETFTSRVIEKTEKEKKYAEDFKRHVKENSPLESMNVLIVGMDGMSKQNLIRAMPKTRNFIINRLNAKELNRFNKYGLNTFPNVVALHAGLTEEELLEKWNNEQYLDVVENEFSWHHYQKAGYHTALVLDATFGTAFHYLKKGWKHPTFDYNTRPLSLMMNRAEDRVMKAGENCAGDIPTVIVLQDFLLQLTSKFNSSNSKHYFAYSFFTQLTHDDQGEASRGDDIYVRFFQQLEQTKVLDNTILIFFSDHGPRFGSFRQTINGNVEAKTPFVFFMFPPWFEKKYPNVMETFEINQNRLTTFFDINKTLLDLLKFSGKTKKGTLQSKGISLFDEIPKERTCLDASIAMEFCNCKLFSNEIVPKVVAYDIVSKFLEILDNKTKRHRGICALLSLKTVISVVRVKMKEDTTNVWYSQTTIETTPGGGVFEALLGYDVASREVVLVGTIIRLNLYKGQDYCVESLDLKLFCYCKSRPQW